MQVDPQFPVIPVRALANKATTRFSEFQHQVIAKYRADELSHAEAQLEIEHFWAGALRRAAIDGDVDSGSIMAGQSVGMVVREQSAAEILAELIGQAAAMLVDRNDGGGVSSPSEIATGTASA